MGIISQKKRIRQEMKEFRNGLDVFAINSMSDEIFKRFMQLDFSGFDKFFVYNSFGSEVHTKKIIENLLSNGKSVYLPKIDENTMQSVRIYADTTFEKNSFALAWV